MSKNKSELTQLNDSVQELIRRKDKFDTCQQQTNKSVEEIIRSLEHCYENSKQAMEVSNQNSKQINNLTSALDKETLENATLTSKIDTLEERLIKMEAQSRRDSLLIDGINETYPEDCEDLIKNIFRSKLNMTDVDSIQIVRAHRLGAKHTNMRKPRTLIVKFQLYKDRMKV